MASFSGRRGPNVSQLLQDLNRIPTQEHSPEEQEFSNIDEDLAKYTNTEFFDWDNLKLDPSLSSQSAKMDLETPSSTSPAADVTSPSMGSLSGLDFSNIPSEFNNYDFGFGASSVPSFPDNLNLHSIQPNPTQGYHAPGTQQNSYAVPPQSGDKRSTDSSSRSITFEEQSRQAAEEDKRRRNTAASARFRVKKKAREQALEKREKELADKVGRLEGRIHHLETENKWLRELVMEKTGGNDTIVSTLLKDFKVKGAGSKDETRETKTETTDKA